MDRRLRKQTLGCVTPRKREHAVQQADRERGTGTDPAPGRNIAVMNHGNPFRQIEIFQHRFDGRVLKLVDLADILDSGINRPVLMFEKRRKSADIQKTVFIDRAG